MSMKLWPPRGGPELPRFVVEFSETSFTTPTESTWLCDAGSPTEAVVLVVKRICREDYSGNAAQPTGDVRYRVWLATPEGDKGLELTGAVNTRTVEDYLVMQRSVEAAPPRLYTVLLARTEGRDGQLCWMTLQARTPTEAFIVCKESSPYELGFTNEFFFSIFEGWKKPNAPSEERVILRMPTVYMHGTVVPQKPKSQKPRETETTSIFIDWPRYWDDGVPYELADAYEEIGWISGAHEDIAKDVNFELLSYLLDRDDYRPAGVIT